MKGALGFETNEVLILQGPLEAQASRVRVRHDFPPLRQYFAQTHEHASHHVKANLRQRMTFRDLFALLFIFLPCLMQLFSLNINEEVGCDHEKIDHLELQGKVAIGEKNEIGE